MDRVANLVDCCLEDFAQDKFGDELGCLGTNDMNAQELAVFRFKNNLDKPFLLFFFSKNLKTPSFTS